jgi:16S rRNA (uracil1498-N3)-methyltransferase
MHLFYTPELMAEVHTLTKDDSRHCAKVLRLAVGDKITLSDGRGFFYPAEIIDDNSKAVTVRVLEKKAMSKGWPQNIHIGFAPTKNIGRTEWALEKCTEMGVDTFSPFISYHSERKAIKNDRLERVITAAAKQSLKAWHPKLEVLQRFEKLVKQPFDGDKLIAYIGEESKQPLSRVLSSERDTLILIGPEGDFSKEEVKLAMESGFTPVSLGSSRLRTETAIVAACHTVHVINELNYE